MAIKGYKHSEETKRKMSLSHIGHKIPLEQREKMGRSGVLNWNWKGGKETELARKCFYQSNRRARKIGNGGFHSLDEWETLKAQYNWTCPCCRKSEPEIKLGADHIIPLIKGGSDNIENIQPLCRSCNSKKHTKIIRFEVVI